MSRPSPTPPTRWSSSSPGGRHRHRHGAGTEVAPVGAARHARACRRRQTGPRPRRGRGCARCPVSGPCPCPPRRALFPDAFVKVLVSDGVDILSVSHVGRGISAHVRSAIEERDPTCVVPGLRPRPSASRSTTGRRLSRRGAHGARATSPALCHSHHAMKTYRGFLLGGRSGKVGVGAGAGSRYRVTPENPPPRHDPRSCAIALCLCGSRLRIPGPSG